MDPELRLKKREEMQVLEALVRALDNREDVFRAVETAESFEEAVGAVGKVLDVDDIHARSVLDMQVRRWTAHERRRLTTHMGQLQRELDAL